MSGGHGRPNRVKVGAVEVLGVEVDPQTRQPLSIVRRSLQPGLQPPLRPLFRRAALGVTGSYKGAITR